MTTITTPKIVMICVICVATLMGGCIESPEYGSGDSIPRSGNLVILEHHPITGDFGILTIEGIAENTGDTSLIYAEIRVKFYDENGAVVDTSLDNINDIGPGEKWNFKVMYFGTDIERIDNYKVAIGTTL